MSSEVSGQLPHGRYYAELVPSSSPEIGLQATVQELLDAGERKEWELTGWGSRRSAGGRCTALLGYCASRLRQEPVLVRTGVALFRP